MIDVPGGAEDERRRLARSGGHRSGGLPQGSEHSADRRLGTRVVERARVEQQPALARAADRPAGRRRAAGAPARRARAAPGRPRTPGPRARAAAARRRPRARARGSRARRRRRRRAVRASPRRARPAPPRAATSIRSTGTSRSAVAGSRYSRSVASSAASDSLSIRSARASGCVRHASIAARVPTISPACGPPSSLSPEKQTTAQPAATERRTGGSSASSGTPSASAPEPTSSITGTPSAHSSSISTSSTKPTVRKFDWCARMTRAGVRPDRGRVVGEPRPVGRAHLDQPRARLRDHVGDPERPADLDELPARHHQLAPAGERGGRQQHGAGAVVDDDRGLGAGQLAQQPLDVRLARPARARLEVVLEVRVAGRDRDHGVDRRRQQAERGRGSCARSRRWR